MSESGQPNAHSFIESTTDHLRSIVVVGASAGGIECLTQLMGSLTLDCHASIFVVQHTASQSSSWLAEILDRAGPLPVSVGQDGEAFMPGHAYVAAPDHHLLLRGGQMLTTQGPRENGSRPAIDPLFRSAAVHHGSRVIGVILSGMLDDGTAGLAAIKRCGGTAVVQSPHDSLYREMPESALRNVEVDYEVSLREMPELLLRLTKQPAGPKVEIPRDLVLEDAMAEAGSGDVRRTEEIGRLSGFTCPECNGPLWQINGETIDRFRCHTGHAFTARALMGDLAQATERALWVALQTMESRRRMLRQLADREAHRANTYSRDSFTAKADELEQYANSIRQFLMDQPKGIET